MALGGDGHPHDRMIHTSQSRSSWGQGTVAPASDLTGYSFWANRNLLVPSETSTYSVYLAQLNLNYLFIPTSPTKL